MVNCDQTSIPPGGVAGRHAHPGDEAIYMLQGALTVAPNGGQLFELKAGQITFNPAKQVHMAKNVSSSEPAKVLNCMRPAKPAAARKSWLRWSSVATRLPGRHEAAVTGGS